MDMWPSTLPSTVISTDTAQYIGTKVANTSQGTNQADVNSPLYVIGDTSITLAKYAKAFHFEGLILDDLDDDVLGCIPFIAHNSEP